MPALADAHLALQHLHTRQATPSLCPRSAPVLELRDVDGSMHGGNGNELVECASLLWDGGHLRVVWGRAHSLFWGSLCFESARGLREGGGLPGLCAPHWACMQVKHRMGRQAQLHYAGPGSLCRLLRASAQLPLTACTLATPLHHHSPSDGQGPVKRCWHTAREPYRRAAREPYRQKVLAHSESLIGAQRESPIDKRCWHTAREPYRRAAREPYRRAAREPYRQKVLAHSERALKARSERAL